RPFTATVNADVVPEPGAGWRAAETALRPLARRRRRGAEEPLDAGDVAAEAHRPRDRERALEVPDRAGVIAPRRRDLAGAERSRGEDRARADQLRESDRPGEGRLGLVEPDEMRQQLAERRGGVRVAEPAAPDRVPLLRLDEALGALEIADGEEPVGDEAEVRLDGAAAGERVIEEREVPRTFGRSPERDPGGERDRRRRGEARDVADRLRAGEAVVGPAERVLVLAAEEPDLRDRAGGAEGDRPVRGAERELAALERAGEGGVEVVRKQRDVVPHPARAHA